MKSDGIKTTLPNGRTLHAITLRHESGAWIGNVILEYHDGERWGILYSYTDYGDYSCKWNAVPKRPTSGFEEFLAMADPDYLLEKLSQAHDERNTFYAEQTAYRVEGHILKAHARDEDAEYLGDALRSLHTVETEGEMWDWAINHSELIEPDDLYSLIVSGPGGYLPGYRKTVIPALKKYLREGCGHV